MAKDFDADFDREEPEGRSSRRYRPDDREDYHEGHEGPAPKKEKSPVLLILGIVAGVLLLCGGGLIATLALLLFPAIQKVREAASRLEMANNMKQIGLAGGNYHHTFDEWVHNHWDRTNQKMLYSWRGELLPYVEQDALYMRLNQDKPWDDPANASVKDAVVRTYLRNSKSQDGNQTYFQAFMGTGAVMDPRSPRKGRLNGQKSPLSLQSMTDGASNTIFFVESGSSVPYLQPKDIAFPADSVPALGSNPKDDRFQICTCDAAVKTLRKQSATAQALKAWACPNDGMVLPIE
ncbi:MAG: DUF1559 domain-containing protein [Gemmataceae bacterium]|jgi:hypothetical protein|nr:DUF1559 domain-containing protein [Gemmataceae bacterium]